MRTRILVAAICTLSIAALVLVTNAARAQQQQRPSSFSPVIEEPFEVVRARDKANKARVMAEHQRLLDERYDLSRRVDDGVKMTRGKPVPVGPTAKLKSGVTWDRLGQMTPEAINEQGVFPYLPLPHVSHPVGGMVFSQAEIKLLPRVERFDMDFDLPDHFLPEFPPAIFLTTRKDLGDVSKGQLVTFSNFYELFNGILNPKQLEGLRLLVSQFPQQQFNATDDRKTEREDGKLGVACFDCHVNGHTSAAFHLVGDIRPQEIRRRIETPSLRGVNIQRLFGSQRALKSVEDFTEFEQRAAYFDGDPVLATKKGVNVLERGSAVHFMSEFHDGRLLTLEDTVEFFNLVLELKLTAQEKKDLVAFMRVL